MVGAKKDDGPQVVELLSDTSGCESRVVSMVYDRDCALTEYTRGDLTEASYGTQAHGQKVVFSADVGARIFEVDKDDLVEELKRFFGEGAFLSDLQDLLDQAGESYSYMSWAGGSVVYRGS